MNTYSTKRQEALDRAKELDNSLKATDPRFRRSVKYIDSEGSVILMESSFILRLDEYYLIFSEHHKTDIIHRDEAVYIAQFERIQIEELPKE